MGSIDCKDLAKTPQKLAGTIKTLASHAAHLAKLLQKTPDPMP